MGEGGKFHAPLDNGLIGYFGVNFSTGMVYDVNGEPVASRQLDRARRRLMAQNCQL